MMNVGMENIIYCDTDSIFSLRKMDESLIDNYALGKWKLEDNVTRGFFLAPKMYCYENDKGEFNGKCKGVKDAVTTWSFWSDILKDQTTKVINKTTFKR